MARLEDLIGIESDLGRLGGILREYARTLGTPVVGAYQVACSDEAEWECVDRFGQSFVGSLLPALRPGCRAAFHSINLGARYESGAIHVAEEHFALEASAVDGKLMVVKINTHVGVRDTPEGPEYGTLDRYGLASACCGALGALLNRSEVPAVRELADTFAAEGKDRLATIQDAAIVPDAHRALVAAITAAALQARRAVADALGRRPTTPTRFLVVPCVSLNRTGANTELLVGRHEIDWTGPTPVVDYLGLGDDPGDYRIEHARGRLSVRDSSG